MKRDRPPLLRLLSLVVLGLPLVACATAKPPAKEPDPAPLPKVVLLPFTIEPLALKEVEMAVHHLAASPDRDPLHHVPSQRGPAD